MKRDCLPITDFTTEEIWETLELAEEIKAKLKSKEEYIKHEEKSCNYMIDYLGLGEKYKIIEQVRFTQPR